MVTFLAVDLIDCSRPNNFQLIEFLIFACLHKGIIIHVF